MKFALLFMLLMPALAYSQQEPIVRFTNPSSLSAPKGYSHVAEVDLGTCRMIIISGQVPLDKQGNLVGKGDLAKQTEQVFTNIRSILEELGGTMKDLVKTGIFMVDASQIAVFREIRNKYVNSAHPPASTLVQVGRLFRDDVLIEIEATAILPRKR